MFIGNFGGPELGLVVFEVCEKILGTENKKIIRDIVLRFIVILLRFDSKASISSRISTEFQGFVLTT